MRILGIDPGSIICGWGVIEECSGTMKLVEYGVIKAQKQHRNLAPRLKEIYLRLLEVINRTSPEEAVFESMFYSRNVQSLIKLSHARSVAILAAEMNNLSIFEYSPREVKKSVTGNGAADKSQVQYMVKALLKIKETPEFFDSTDALAAAICHVLRRTNNSSSSLSWKDYIKKHPERVK